MTILDAIREITSRGKVKSDIVYGHVITIDNSSDCSNKIDDDNEISIAPDGILKNVYYIPRQPLKVEYHVIVRVYEMRSRDTKVSYYILHCAGYAC